MFAGEDQMMLMLIVGGGTLFVTLILGFALVGGDNASSNAKRRLSNLSHGHAPVAPKSAQRNSARIDDRQSSIKALDTLARKFIPKPAELKARLEKTGTKLTTAEYALICLVTNGGCGCRDAFRIRPDLAVICSCRFDKAD